MKAYCINLDRRPDRLAHMTAEFARAGIPFERIPAVDGQDPEVAAAAAEIPVSFEGAQISAGAYGCLQSHRNTWRRLVDSGDDWAMIFEDDLVLVGGLQPLLSEDWLPKDADIVKLETWGVRIHVSRKQNNIVDGRNVAQFFSTHIGAGSYVIRADTARRLLAETATGGDPVDEFLFNARLPFFSSARIYQMIPAPAIQGDRVGVANPKLHSGWQGTSIVDRLANGPDKTVAPETTLRRLWRRGREEIRARVRGTQYVVVPHG